MSTPFSAESGLIVLPARVWGPAEQVVAQLALDTGATTTLVSAALLRLTGYDPAVTPERTRVTTGSGIEFVASVSVDRIEALGCERAGFPVLCHTLPPTAGVDGLLGLDFLRGCRLTIDFRTGCLTLD